MSTRKLSDDEAVALWREAERRLRLVDREPPLAMARVDALLDVLGPRRTDESLRAWLERGRQRAPQPASQPMGEVIHVDFGRRRFRPVAEIVRLAADTAGDALQLPARELETDDGRFRLRVTPEGDQVVVAVQALGLASDQFAGRLLGILGDDQQQLVAAVRLDEDGDGEVRLPDSPELRRALLRPVLGVVEED